MALPHKFPASLAFVSFLIHRPFKNVSYPSPSRYTWVSLHTGRTRPMVHWLLQRGNEDTEAQDRERPFKTFNLKLFIDGQYHPCALILVTHTCLSWGSPCPAGCSHACCQGWKRRSGTWLWRGWRTPAAPPAAAAAGRRRKTKYETERNATGLTVSKIYVCQINSIKLPDCTQGKISCAVYFPWPSWENQIKEVSVVFHRETRTLAKVHLKDHACVF